MFHKNSCQCCNEYGAHTVQACKDEGMHLPWQAISDAVTTAWPELMRDLERIAEERILDDYKALEDDVARLTTKLEAERDDLRSQR
jgi:ubiquinone biosynthesis protein UbiJ